MCQKVEMYIISEYKIYAMVEGTWQDKLQPNWTEHILKGLFSLL